MERCGRAPPESHPMRGHFQILPKLPRNLFSAHITSFGEESIMTLKTSKVFPAELVFVAGSCKMTPLVQALSATAPFLVSNSTCGVPSD
jgi:hypothetical protein